MAKDLTAEVKRRRTFAIISHPDAGKTTLTETLLLHSGAIQQSGSVTAKRGQKHATSDFMAMEQQRGISITSSALQFEFNGMCINLLDTPGHEDFSEDTYRTLMAVDSAVMVLDAGKGVEAQTKKLFAVCRERRIPIFTFINKMDKPGLDPYDLLDEVEEVLGITAIPLTWPVGDPGDFRGVFERGVNRIHVFERTAGNRQRPPETVSGLDDPYLKEVIGPTNYMRLQEDMEVINDGMPQFDPDLHAKGEITPVFFGSALTHFGVENFLQHFIRLAPPPGPLLTEEGVVEPTDPQFFGFVYKIMANLDKSHRDRVAFVRVVSGRFDRGMSALHVRLNRQIKMAYPCRLFGGERFTIDEAFPGDVMGLVNPGLFKIGDVISTGKKYEIDRFPVFAPDRFMSVQLPDPSKRKNFKKGLSQLGEEGVVQLFYEQEGGHLPILGAVGQLQFEVFAARMKEEYRVDLILKPLDYQICKWLSKDGYQPNSNDLLKLVYDPDGHPVILFRGQWELGYAAKHYPELVLLNAPEGAIGVFE